MPACNVMLVPSRILACRLAYYRVSGFGAFHSIELIVELKGFVDGNFECKFLYQLSYRGQLLSKL